MWTIYEVVMMMTTLKEKAIERFNGLPNWGKATTVVGGLFVLGAFIDAVHEPDPLSAFFEILISSVLSYALPVVVVGGSIWAGIKAAGRTRRNWLGWLSGFITLYVLMLGYRAFTENFPTIGRRIDATSDCYVDWNGRSNPSVCD